jgi:hypothetical protein
MEGIHVRLNDNRIKSIINASVMVKIAQVKMADTFSYWLFEVTSNVAQIS